MNDAIVGSAAASSSKIRTASMRRSPLPPTSSCAVDRRDAELRGFAQHIDGEVLVGIPVQGMRCKAFGGERRRRLDDDALVVVHLEQSMSVRSSSWSG